MRHLEMRRRGRRGQGSAWKRTRRGDNRRCSDSASGSVLGRARSGENVLLGNRNGGGREARKDSSSKVTFFLASVSESEEIEGLA